MSELTTRKIRITLEEQMKMDLKPYKAFIKEQIGRVVNAIEEKSKSTPPTVASEKIEEPQTFSSTSSALLDPAGSLSESEVERLMKAIKQFDPTFEEIKTIAPVISKFRSHSNANIQVLAKEIRKQWKQKYSDNSDGQNHGKEESKTSETPGDNATTTNGVEKKEEKFTRDHLIQLNELLQTAPEISTKLSALAELSNVSAFTRVYVS